MGEIILKGVEKWFGDVKVIQGIDLKIDEGEFVVFVGPSGCGKSTLLRMICGLEELSDGEIWVGQKDVSQLAPAERQLAMVFQSYALYPHMSVRRNIGFGLRIAGFDKATTKRKVEEAARILEIEPLLDRRPRDLSGGQRQRVAIGRAIVRSPQAFLFDEPLSNLDASLRVQMRMEIINLHKELKKTMIYVTHDQVEAMTMADRIVVLKDGKIMQVDDPITLYESPNNQFVAGFIGSPRMNFFSLDVPGGTLGVHGVALSEITGTGEKGGATPSVLGVRPEHFHMSKEDGIWKGTVGIVEHLGSETYYHVRIGGSNEDVVVRAVDQANLQDGDTVFLSPDTKWCYLFDERGDALYF
jgi:multiple sugar transport system ATP-binding protein